MVEWNNEMDAVGIDDEVDADGIEAVVDVVGMEEDLNEKEVDGLVHDG